MVSSGLLKIPKLFVDIWVLQLQLNLVQYFSVFLTLELDHWLTMSVRVLNLTLTSVPYTQVHSAVTFLMSGLGAQVSVHAYPLYLQIITRCVSESNNVKVYVAV